MDRDAALNAWQSMTLEEGMLPSGVIVQIERDLSAAGMVQRGIMPADLRALALRFSSEAGVTLSELDEEEADRYRRMELHYVAQLVRAVKPPGAEGFTSLRLTVEELETDPPSIPAVDLEALQDIVRRRRTLRQVDALSRLQRDLITPEEAARITDEEFGKTILGWRQFRDRLRSTVGGDDSKDVDDKAVQPADHLGPGARPRRRRSTRAKAGKSQAAADAA